MCWESRASEIQARTMDEYYGDATGIKVMTMRDAISNWQQLQWRVAII
jgi:hypothetical protein